MSQFSDDISEEDKTLIKGLCGQYLGRLWKSNRIIIKRFNEGYFNKIFYCRLNGILNVEEGQDNEVVVKLALEHEFYLYIPLNSIINTLVISEARLGPKVLGVFDGGVITEFIESRSFGIEDYDNPKLLSLLAKKLARLHSLESPIPRDGSDKWIEVVCDEFVKMDTSDNQTGSTFDCVKGVYELIKSSEYEWLKRLDFAQQLIWVKKCILSSNKVLVLSHCDFNRGNILICKNTETLDLFFVDFDFTSYNYRGIDFGRLFSSWRHTDPNFGDDGYPTDQEMNRIFEAYIEEWDRITVNQFSKNESNCKEQLIKEAKLFTLAGIIIDLEFCLWKVGDDLQCAQEFLDKGNKRYAFYLFLKKKFQREGSVPPD